MSCFWANRNIGLFAAGTALLHQRQAL
uniref:Uncharacterized protein n=1 Tax=Rhizophora mucronata TaxID=61149 RepID=A0A2P2NGQ0_RHIMU